MVMRIAVGYRELKWSGEPVVARHVLEILSDVCGMLTGSGGLGIDPGCSLEAHDRATLTIPVEIESHSWVRPDVSDASRVSQRVHHDLITFEEEPDHRSLRLPVVTDCGEPDDWLLLQSNAGGFCEHPRTLRCDPTRWPTCDGGRSWLLLGRSYQFGDHGVPVLEEVEQVADAHMSTVGAYDTLQADRCPGPVPVEVTAWHHRFD